MKMGGKAKSQACLIEAAPRLHRITLQRYSQLGKYIGTSALAGNCTIAMLHHGNPGSCNHESRGGADVERSAAITAAAKATPNVIFFQSMTVYFKIAAIGPNPSSTK